MGLGAGLAAIWALITPMFPLMVAGVWQSGVTKPVGGTEAGWQDPHRGCSHALEVLGNRLIS